MGGTVIGKVPGSHSGDPPEMGAGSPYSYKSMAFYRATDGSRAAPTLISSRSLVNSFISAIYMCLIDRIASLPQHNPEGYPALSFALFRGQTSGHKPELRTDRHRGRDPRRPPRRAFLVARRAYGRT